MEYTNESLKEWAKLNLRQYALKSLGRLLELYAAAWAQEVAELEKDKEELRELCGTLNKLVEKPSCVSQKEHSRFLDLWAKHMEGGEG